MFGIFGKKKAPILACKRGRGWTIPLVGTSHYQTVLLGLAGSRKTDEGVTLDVRVMLQHEEGNPHDQNAIAAFVGKKQVGYMRSEDSQTFRDFLEKNGATNAECDARIIGGWDRGGGDNGNFGVRLNLSWPPKKAG